MMTRSDYDTGHRVRVEDRKIDVDADRPAEWGWGRHFYCVTVPFGSLSATAR